MIILGAKSFDISSFTAFVGRFELTENTFTGEIKMGNKSKLKLAVLATAVVMSGIANQAFAESNFQTGNSSLTATAHVDFQINVPKMLFLRVGTGTTYANDTTVNLITFDVPVTSNGSGGPISATASSGDLGNGIVTAVVRGNNGDISFSSTTAGTLNNTTGSSIEWSEITTTASALNTGTVLAAPALASTATSTVTLTAVNKVVNQDAKWTYKYANSAIVPYGTYGGAGGAQNGRVTYTATSP